MSLLVSIDPDNLGEAKETKAAPDRLLAGDPSFRTWELDDSRSGEVSTGIWEATPGTTRSIKGETFEFCHILSGVVEITPEGGAPVVYRAGDSFVMKPGLVSTWRTIETVRKIFVVVG